MAKPNLSSPALAALLRRKYSLPEWVSFEELGEKAGFSRRRLDLVAMNLFPSRGLQIVGFEIKANRSDFLREIKAPEKAEAFYDLLDEFYVVANKDVIETTAELPSGWGLILPSGRGLRVVHKSIRNFRPKLSHAIDRSFVAAMLRKLTNERVGLRESAGRKFHDAGVEFGKRQAARSIEAADSEARRAREALAKIDSIVGMKVEVWNADRIGDAVKMILDSKAAGYRSSIEEVVRRMRFITSNLESLLQDGIPGED